MVRTKLIAVLATALLTSSCGYAGAMTNTMAMPPAGNGRSFDLGAVRVQSAVVVAHSDGSGSLSVSLVNRGDSPVTIAAVNIAGTKAVLNPAVQTVAAGAILRIGYESENYIDVVAPLTIGAMTPVAIALSDGSVGGTEALVVADTGEYAAVNRGPLPEVNPAASASPSASPTS